MQSPFCKIFTTCYRHSYFLRYRLDEPEEEQGYQNKKVLHPKHDANNITAKKITHNRLVSESKKQISINLIIVIRHIFQDNFIHVGELFHAQCMP